MTLSGQKGGKYMQISLIVAQEVLWACSSIVQMDLDFGPAGEAEYDLFCSQGKNPDIQQRVCDKYLKR
jgi:hypothetical protein